MIELEITGYGYEGKGITKIPKSVIKPNSASDENTEKSDYVILVDGSYPGDKVKARLLKIKSAYAKAKTIEILVPSDKRIKTRCKFFGVCGGCKQQNLDYAIQLRYKQEQVEEIFEHIGGLKDFEIEPIVSAENIFYYRNKMEFSFSDKRWLTQSEIDGDEIENKNFALGLHIPRIFDKVLDIDECFLQSGKSNEILNFTRNFFRLRKTSIYSTKTHTGYLRNLVIRQSQNTDDLMVNLVTSKEDNELMKEYTSELINAVSGIATVINNINLKKASVAIGDYEKVYHGNGFIYDKIGNYTFRISANSFFQTNTLQAENLYKAAIDFAELNSDEIIYDLYSGAGTIAIYCSGKAKQVYGFENAKLNKVENVDFNRCDLYKSFLPVIKKKNISKPDVIIIDPPRSGMHKNTVEDTLQLNPVKIVYVSCNPTTQARDIKMMMNGGYKLSKIRPVDMFPHTYHIENVALLEKL
jgi:23S rRNA (uracil1939-C5)-methyltransferase